jgi:hypothetical protein
MEIKTLEEIKGLYKFGGYIRKANYTPFNVQFFDHSKHLQYMKINTASYTNNRLTINGVHFSDVLPLSITEAEALQLQKEWEELVIGDNRSENTEFEHFREDNGEEKVGYSKEAVKYILFKFQKNKPEGNFGAYICSVCNKYHIGKSKQLTNG